MSNSWPRILWRCLCFDTKLVSLGLSFSRGFSFSFLFSFPHFVYFHLTFLIYLSTFRSASLFCFVLFYFSFFFFPSSSVLLTASRCPLWGCWPFVWRVTCLWQSWLEPCGILREIWCCAGFSIGIYTWITLAATEFSECWVSMLLYFRMQKQWRPQKFVTGKEQLVILVLTGGGGGENRKLGI